MTEDGVTSNLSSDAHSRPGASALLIPATFSHADEQDEHSRFEAAFSNLNQGLCMFDPSLRVTVCNGRYLEIYGLSPQAVRPGCPLRELYELKVKAGTFFGDPDQDIDRIVHSIARQETITRDVELMDGRVISVVTKPIGKGSLLTTHEDISERRRAERDLVQARNFLDTIISNVPAAIIVKQISTLRYLFLNKTAEQLFRLRTEEVTGKTAREVYASEVADLIEQRDREAINGRSKSLGGSLEHMAGDPTRLLSVTRKIIHGPAGEPEYLVLLLEDVSARHRAEQELIRTKNFLDTVINHVPATIIVKDAKDLRYTLINKRAEEFLGRPIDEVIGRTAHHLFCPEIAQSIISRDQASLNGDQPSTLEGHPEHERGEGAPMVSTKKEIIRGTDGKPEYLLTVIEDITERTRSAERLAFMARHDALTGLANRVQFTEKASDALAQLTRMKSKCTIFLLDLDHFKSVNDSLGHPVGDALLKEVARRLLSSTRETDLVARFGGDEFAILQTLQEDQREGAIALANRLHDVIAAPYAIDGHQVVIGTSVGIAFAPEHGRDIDHLVKCADLALYQAKSEGRNRHAFFQAVMEIEARARHAIETDLRTALTRNEFELHYQNIIDIATNEVCGAEALVRWRHPQRGLVVPDQFIPVAEQTGLIVPLGDWILRTACGHAAAWPMYTRLAVNLSPVQFGKGDIVDVVSRALLDSGLAPERLELEITETVLLQHNEHNIALLHELKNLGVSIVLDDFGTGYSSLSYLKMFPFDKIKIDRSFVQEVSSRSDCAAIVCAIIGLGRSLNIVTTAEGIEMPEQLMLLRAVGCSLAQGYLFGRPVPESEIEFSSRSRSAPRTNAA